MKIVKNAIKRSYQQANNVSEATLDQYFSGSGDRYDPVTGYLLNPASYSFTCYFSGENIPVIVDFHNVDYTNYATEVTLDGNPNIFNITWEDLALSNFGFSIRVLDNRGGWDIKSAIVINNDYTDAVKTSLYDSSYKLFDIEQISEETSIGWADATHIRNTSDTNSDSLNISGTVTNYNAQSRRSTTLTAPDFQTYVTH